MTFWPAGEMSEELVAANVFGVEGSWAKCEDEESAGVVSEAGGVAGNVVDAEGEDEEWLCRSGNLIRGWPFEPTSASGVGDLIFALSRSTVSCIWLATSGFRGDCGERGFEAGVERAFDAGISSIMDLYFRTKATVLLKSCGPEYPPCSSISAASLSDKLYPAGRGSGRLVVVLPTMTPEHPDMWMASQIPLI